MSENIKVLAEREDIVAIANAVRNKTGSTNEMTLGGIVSGINGISTNPTLQSKTVTPTTSQQSVTADSGYDGLDTVTVNAIPSTYVKPTTTKSATTYTPTTSNQTISAGTYCSGAQTIKGDSNLVAENIAEGVSIFGVTGTHAGSSGGASVETCTIDYTISGYSELGTLRCAYTSFVNGEISSNLSYLDEANRQIIISDVICNSTIYISGGFDLWGATVSGTAEVLYSGEMVKATIIKASSVAGEYCTITLYDDD